MPKVNPNYIHQKKEQILDAALRVFHEKPLYNITMTDIIKTCGMSKGGIYLYYTNMDDIFIEMINRETQDVYSLDKTTSIIGTDLAHKDCLEIIFNDLVHFIESCPDIIAKIQFELNVYWMTHPEKAEYFGSNLNIQHWGQTLMHTLHQVLDVGIKDKTFKCLYSADEMSEYISASIDGIVGHIVRARFYEKNSVQPDPQKMIQMLNESVCALLQAK